MIGEVLWGLPGRDTPIDTTEIPVPLPGLAEPLAPLRVAVVSDLHFGQYVKAEFARRVVETVNALSADAIVLPGDTVADRPWRARPCGEILAGLRAPLGVFAVLGNHDHYAGCYTVTQELRRAGVEVLTNRGQRIERAGASLWLAGVGDYYHGEPDLAAALADRRDGEPTVLLAHNPDFVEMLDPRDRVGLMISGHTHGGQVAPFNVPVVTRVRHRRYVWGLRRCDAGWVYTSAGVGLCGLPVRVNRPPETPVLELQRA